MGNILTEEQIRAQAIEAGLHEYYRQVREVGGTSHEMFRAAIEAYEAAMRRPFSEFSQVERGGQYLVGEDPTAEGKYTSIELVNAHWHDGKLLCQNSGNYMCVDGLSWFMPVPGVKS